MGKRFTGDKLQRYSFRKLSIGLVSATIGSFFLSTALGGVVSPVEAEEVSVQKSALVQYHYVVDTELTETEKKAVIKELPKFVEEGSDSYYLVYRPKSQSNPSGSLPRTGSSSLLEASLAVAGLSLVVLVISRGKNGKRFLLSVLLITGLGSFLLAPSVLALTNIELAVYNQSLNLTVGDKLPAPLDIEGYEYLGYFKGQEEAMDLKNSSQGFTSSKKEPVATKNNTKTEEKSAHQVNEIAENHYASHEVEQLTEQEKEIIAAQERQFARLSPVQEVPELQVTTQETNQSLPYLTEYQYSDELAQGQSKVIRAGILGKRTILTRHYQVGQELVKAEEISNQVTVEPVSEIILVGTASTTSLPKESPVEEKPSVTNYGTSPDTAPVNEVPELSDYGTVPETSPVQEIPELSAYGTNPDTAPVHEVPELSNYGTVPETSAVQENSELDLMTTDETHIEKIDFNIEEQYTDEIPEGSRQIVTPGVRGERTIKTRVYSSNGQEVDRQELSNEETLAPVIQIVKVGTAKPNMVPNEAPKADTLPEYPLTYTDETRVEKIAFNIEEQYTDELPQDARQIATPGVEGERTIKTRVYSSNGQEIDRQELSNEETLAPVTQIVKVIEIGRASCRERV